MNQDSIGKSAAELDERFVPINFNMIVSLPNGRQVSASTSFYPVPGASPNDLLDRMSAALERQRAKAEIAEFDEEIEKHEESIAKANEDLQRLDAECTAKVDVLIAEGRERQGEYEKAMAEERRKVEEGGGNRTFDADKPGVQARVRPYLTRVAECKVEVEKLEKERDAGHANHATNMSHFAKAIDKLKAKREARVKIVG